MNFDQLAGTPLHMQGQLIVLMEALASVLRAPPERPAAWIEASEDIAQLLDQLEHESQLPAETVTGMRDMSAWLIMRCSPKPDASTG
jgi:hypothetical protein